MAQDADSGYDPSAVEDRWQREWDERDVFRIEDDATDPTYVLGMFPYTSGNLHMGHVRNYTITDAYARYRRMRGDPVLHPMGWDSFGLPAENAARERDTDPEEWTLSCIEAMREQMDAMGFGYDWDREVTTCSPDYYRWNQWLFNRFYEAGLVERKGAAVNWCPSCETVLADEQVEGDDERCWRCDTPVTRRELDQWFFRITEYADELVDALDALPGWPESVRGMQRDWIGRQRGAAVEFEVREARRASDGSSGVPASDASGGSSELRSDGEQSEPRDYGPVEVFTTRLDTICGATFFALAPDHEIARELAATDDEVAHFVREVADLEGDEPQGVETDLTATNPVTGEEVPVFVADFVLAEVGTGALMGVPGHDERDHAFARKMGIDIVPVVAPSADEVPDVEAAAYIEDGVLVNSGAYDGLDSATARDRIREDLEGAREDVQYRLRDWGISRQRYWGTPIPVVHCDDCGPVPDEDLPVELPAFVETTGNPLAAVEEFVETTCPECGAPARRETDTMDTFVDSSWYFLRYVSPHLDDAPFDPALANDWMPVDQYVGGIEHAVMHLLYARFVTKALADLGTIDHREPFRNLVTQGMVLLDGEKMSKSKGNVVSPQAIVEEYGADTARLFIMQAARPERDFDWSEEGVRSSHRFVERLYGLVRSFADGGGASDAGGGGASTDGAGRAGDEDADAGDGGGDTADAVRSGSSAPAAAYLHREIDRTVAVATDSYDSLSFTDGLRELRGLVSLVERYRDYAGGDADPAVVGRALRAAVRLLAPVAPHVCEELWAALGGEGLVATAAWPTFDGDLADVELERRLIEETREDVRDIVEVAGIEDPEHVELVVAPDWKYEAHEVARTADAEDVVGAVMAREDVRDRGEAAASFAGDLQAERHALARQLPPAREAEVLRQAGWLLAQEFGAEVTVRTAEPGEAAADRARPGHPAIEID